MIGEYKPLNSINEAIPPAIDDLVKDCLVDVDQRLKSAHEFYQRLIKATRPHSNLSVVLSSGPLHETIAALTEQDENTFVNLPTGQRILILTRAKTLINKDDYRLRNPAATLIAELVRIGTRLPEKEYRFIIDNAFKYGFDLDYSERWTGNPKIRTEISSAAFVCGSKAHKTISESIIEFFDKDKLDGKEGWYLHDLRITVQNLLSNISCSEDVGEQLGQILEDLILTSTAYEE